MKIKSTYRFISVVVFTAMLSAVIMPVFASFGMMEHCSTMAEMTASSAHDHDSMVTASEMDGDCCNNSESMSHHPKKQVPENPDTCDMAIDCNCDFQAEGVLSHALSFQKIQVPQIGSDFTVLEFSNAAFDPIPPPLWFSNSYSPPLLFLAHASFLI